ncbi:MAG: PKD domain-containing protein [Vicingaceae bacterium]
MVTFKNSITFIILNLFIITAFSQSTNAFRFQLVGNGFSDETVIRLKSDGTLNFDGNYDAAKLFSPNPNVPSIYSQICTGQKMSINTLPEFNKDTSITIYTNIPANGTYTLNVTEIMALTSTYKVSISDIQSSTDFRILGDTSLVFNYTVQQNAPTFTFNISTDAVHTVTNETCFALNDGELSITNTGSTNWNAIIKNDANSIIATNTAVTETLTFTNLLPGNYNTTISSKGIVEQLNFTVAPAAILTADFSFDKDTIYLSNGASTTINNNSVNAQNHNWDFGDGNTSNDNNPIHNYNNTGVYQVSLTTTNNNNCTVQSAKTITVLDIPTGIEDFASTNNRIIKKNKSYQINLKNNAPYKVLVYDIKGAIIYQNNFTDNQHKFSLANFDTGIYIINVVSENKPVIQEKIFN